MTKHPKEDSASDSADSGEDRPEETERVYPTDPNPTVPPVIYASGPCSCCNLQLETGCKVVAGIGTILGIILLFIGATVLAMQNTIVDLSIDKESGNVPEDKNQFAEAIEDSSLLSILRGFHYPIFYLILGVAASKRNRCLCKTWICIQITLIALSVTAGVYFCAESKYALIILAPLSTIFMEIYFIWVVMAFCEELKVVGVVGGSPVILNASVFNAELMTLGIYGPGNESGRFPQPGDKYYPQNAANPQANGPSGQPQDAEFRNFVQK